MQISRPSISLQTLVYKRLSKCYADMKGRIAETLCECEVGMGPVHKDFVRVEQAQTELFEQVTKGQCFSPYQEGPFGEFPWKQRWFKIEIPAAQTSELGLRYLEWNAHGESTIYIDGLPWAGLDCCHPTAPLPDEACTLYLDCGLWQTGIWGDVPPPDELGFIFKSAKLLKRNACAWKVFNDLEVLKMLLDRLYKVEGKTPKINAGLADDLNVVSPLFRKLLATLSKAFDVYDTQGLEAFSTSLDEIYQTFKTDPLLGTASYVGHAHIDLVWLWPERATYKKAIHTFATQLRLMERYPDYTFTMSQPPLYYHLLQEEPEQAKAIAQRIQEGRWEFTGALEVEADTQIPVGEGLARSIIYGQERIEAVRGEKSSTVWIPDVFGYSQCLPQLFALAGIKNFYTTKILWTEVSRFPHNSFVWKSPDGSEVLTHLAVAGYNCKIDVEEVSDGIREYQQSGVHSEMLCAAGYGDGGGGATEGHCERAQRMSDLSGLPKAQWSTVEGFFDRLESCRSELPHYRGELYLEYHRGVQTSQSDFKFNLREAEKALQTREALRVIQGMGPLDPEEWLRYLFAHFHDAIPGSSINTVYAELNPELEGIARHQLACAKDEWLTKASEAPSESRRVTIVNPLAFKRSAQVMLATPKQGFAWCDVEGRALKQQRVTSDDGSEQMLVCLELDSLQSVVLEEQKVEMSLATTLSISSHSLKSDRVNASFESGQLVSLEIDGQAIALDGAAHFSLHVDQPEAYDAWDIDHQATWLKEVVGEGMALEVVESGPVRVALRGECSVGEKSHLVVHYRLTHGQAELEVQCDLDWREDHRWLRYNVPTSYRGSMARFGAPFGSVDRSQVEGLPIQEAMWEVPASRWASVLDGQGRGMSIVSEAKYGFSAKEGHLTLSLLRSPTEPDPVCDRGQHRISFCLSAHRDETACGTEVLNLSTAAKADALYTKVLSLEGAHETEMPFSWSTLGSVVPAWVMPCRTGKGYLIRLHEVAGAEQELGWRPKTWEGIQGVSLVDLNEKPLENCVKSDDAIRFTVRAHQIVTLKVQL